MMISELWALAGDELGGTVADDKKQIGICQAGIAGGIASRIFSLLGTNPNCEPLYGRSHERKRYDEPEPARSAKSTAGSAAAQRSETGSAESGAHKG
jgi:hypothetical protein